MPDIKINKIIAEPGNQVTQKAVWELVAELQANVRALHAKLDADTGVTDTNYAATLNTEDVFVK